MKKIISLSTLGILVFYLAFSMINVAFEKKYGEIEKVLWIDREQKKIYYAQYTIPAPIIDTVTIKREENYMIIETNKGKIKIPIVLELENPLLRK